MSSRRSDAAVVRADAGPDTQRTLPADVLHVDEPPVDQAAVVRAVDDRPAIAAIDVEVPIAGIDLGPRLAAEVSAEAATWFPAKHHAIARIGALIDRLPPAGILLADEYHRQDWLAAAAAEGVPVAAVQHGLIYRRAQRLHPPRRRPPQLRLPDRTYVFGRWERDLLVDQSVYRADEVVVGGSPRLDLVEPAGAGRPATPSGASSAWRRATGWSCSPARWGAIYRRFHYPVALAALVRPAACPASISSSSSTRASRTRARTARSSRALPRPRGFAAAADHGRPVESTCTGCSRAADAHLGHPLDGPDRGRRRRARRTSWRRRSRAADLLGYVDGRCRAPGR